MWFLGALLLMNVIGADNQQIEEVTMKEEQKPKVLVVYYSRTGITEKIGGLLAVALEADQEKVTDKKDRSGIWGYIVAGKDAGLKNLTEIGELKHDPADYDLVIIGTPIWAWKMAPAIRTYIDKNREKLKNVVFYTTAGGTSYEKVVPEMEEFLGHKAMLKDGFLEKEVKKDSKEMIEKLNKFLEDIKELIAVKA